MTGFIQKTLEQGKNESVGVITDFVDPDPPEFIKIITEVSGHYIQTLMSNINKSTVL